MLRLAITLTDTVTGRTISDAVGSISTPNVDAVTSFADLDTDALQLVAEMTRDHLTTLTDGED